jgi:hypothetical protein
MVLVTAARTEHYVRKRTDHASFAARCCVFPSSPIAHPGPLLLIIEAASVLCWRSCTQLQKRTGKKEAVAQGPHRFARGLWHFEYCRTMAEQHAIPFGCRLEIIRGAGHVDQVLFDRAAELLAAAAQSSLASSTASPAVER